MVNIDERLLAAQYDDRLRQERSGGADGRRQAEPAAADKARQTGGEKQQSLRQRYLAARQAKDKIAEKVTSPARAGTSKALRWAWMALIPSWGLSAIWLNLHVLLKFIFGEKLFCKLGDEWLPAKADAAAGEAGKTLKRGVGMIETMGLIFIDVIIFFVVMGLLTLIINEGTTKTITNEATPDQPAVNSVKK